MYTHILSMSWKYLERTVHECSAWKLILQLFTICLTSLFIYNHLVQKSFFHLLLPWLWIWIVWINEFMLSHRKYIPFFSNSHTSTSSVIVFNLWKEQKRLTFVFMVTVTLFIWLLWGIYSCTICLWRNVLF